MGTKKKKDSAKTKKSKPPPKLASGWKETPREEEEIRLDLVEEYGQPCHFTTNRKGERQFSKINENYFAGLFSKLNPGILHDFDEERTYTYDPKSGLWGKRAPEEINVEIQKFLLQESKTPGLEAIEAKRSLQQGKNIHDFVKGITGVRGIFNFDPRCRTRVLHFTNGVIPIVDGVMQDFSTEFRPDHYSRNQIPVAYDPKAECPRFINELLSPALPEETREEDIQLLAMCFGLFMLGVNLPQKMLILDGYGESGKSTTAKVAGLLVGENNRAMLRTDHLGGRFELFGYIGRTLLMGADVDPNFLRKPGANQLKSLVGGDMLQAEGKHTSEMVPIRGSFNVLITANAALRVKIENDREAWRRRLIIVRFQEHTPKKRIESFENVLFREEGSGIANWALNGLRTALDYIYNGTGKFPMTAAHMARVDDLLAQSEAIESFARDHLELAEGCALTKREIRERLGDYCRENNWEIPAKNEIGRRLPIILKTLFGVTESNSVSDGGKSVQGYYGIGWREITD